MPPYFDSKEMRALKGLLLLFLFAAISFAQAKELPGQRVAISGTKVSLIPPVGFTPSPQFPGYWQESLGASIMVTEIPGPFPATSAGFSDSSQLIKRGMSLLYRQEIVVDSRMSILLQVKQAISGLEYLKWVLIFGDEKESVLVVAAFPTELKEELSEKLKKSILTSAWDRERNVSPTEGLNFTVSAKGEMRLTKRLINLLAYTKDGVFPSESVDDPIFIVGSSIPKINVEDQEGFAKSRIVQTTSVTDLEIEQSEKITIDNLAGYEVIAKGKDIKSGQPMLIYQTMLFEGQTYYLMQGLVSSKNRQVYLPVFKEMARSFKRKQ